MKPSDHIVPGSKCCVCNENPGTVLARFVAADDQSAGDAMLFAAATCWDCARTLGQVVTAATIRDDREDVVDEIARDLLGLDARFPRLDIEDDRTFAEKLQDGDAQLEPDEPYCEICTWPERLCVCAGANRGRRKGACSCCGFDTLLDHGVCGRCREPRSSGNVAALNVASKTSELDWKMLAYSFATRLDEIVAITSAASPVKPLMVLGPSAPTKDQSR